MFWFGTKFFSHQLEFCIISFFTALASVSVYCTTHEFDEDFHPGPKRQWNINALSPDIKACPVATTGKYLCLLLLAWSFKISHKAYQMENTKVRLFWNKFCFDYINQLIGNLFLLLLCDFSPWLNVSYLLAGLTFVAGEIF